MKVAVLTFGQSSLPGAGDDDNPLSQEKGERGVEYLVTAICKVLNNPQRKL